MARRPAKGTGNGEAELVFCALGGLGEIGMNVYLYGLGPQGDRRWLIVDLGLTFPNDQEPGVDVVLPDLSFIEAEKERIEGLVLTHAHEDHIGAVVDLWPRLNCPIYATPFTAGMLKSKSAEFGGRTKLPVTEVRPGSRFKVGAFDVELVSMAHSIPETSALALRTPFGLVLHTGDWKLDAAPLVGDPSDEKRLKELGEEGVTAIVCDSTNAFRDGISPSETDVAHSLAEIVKGAKRRVVVTTFASNVARIRAVADAAAASGRQLVVAGRAMHRVIDVAKDTGYLPMSFKFLDQSQFGYLEREDVVLLCTGSQGEARAALARIAEDEHPDIALAAGDTVIFSSRTIPGNEKVVGRVQNNLSRMGCDVVTDGEKLVHVTGHPRREELRRMYAWTRPGLAIPMHGEARHLRENARVARESGVPAVLTPIDGQMVRIAPGQPRLLDEIPVGRLYRDGKLIVPSVEGPVRERRRLAFSGLIAVGIVMSSRGEVLAAPEIALDGVPADTAAGRPMDDVVFKAVRGALQSIPAARRRDLELVEEAVRRAARNAVDEHWGKKPVVKVLISQPEAKG